MKNYKVSFSINTLAVKSLTSCFGKRLRILFVNCKMAVLYSMLYSSQGKRLALLLGSSLFILPSVIANPGMHNSVYKKVFDITFGVTVKDTVASYHTAIDPAFHICSVDLKCTYIVEDVTTGKFSTYSLRSQVPPYQANHRVWEKHFTRKGINLKIQITSIGNDDPLFRGSSSLIAVNEVVYSFRSKGIHAVILSSEDGKFIKSDSFDMVDDSKASSKLVAFLDACPRAGIVLISTFDDATVHLNNDAKERLSTLGAESKIGFRDSFALVTQKGTLKPGWFKEGHAVAGEGPVKIAVQIEL